MGHNPGVHPSWMGQAVGSVPRVWRPVAEVRLGRVPCYSVALLAHRLPGARSLVFLEGGVVIPTSDEPIMQAQAIMENVLRLITECRSVLRALERGEPGNHRARRPSGFSTSR
jgi:hypothetical protein